MDKKTVLHYSFLTLFTGVAILGFVFLFQQFHSPFSKAQDNLLTLKIKLQGERYSGALTKTNVFLYSSQGKVSEFTDVIFSYQADKTFQGDITLKPDFNYDSLYSIYIKPTNYFGKLFCTTSVVGKDCTVPQFIFKQAGSIIDLSAQTFFGGDISPANGKVDSYDISKIMANLGNSSDLSTDINTDGSTNTIDYILALYSLSKNMTDDGVALVFVAPSSTPVLTSTPVPSTTPIPTSTPAPTFTPIPSLTPSITPSPRPTNTPTPAPSATPVPTATPVPAAPRCHVTPDAPNTPFYLNVGGRTACGCSPSGLGCGHLVCSTCPSGVCECPQPGGVGNAGCSNGGTITAVVDSIFGGCP